MSTTQKILIAAGVIVVLGAIVGVSLYSTESAKGEEVYMADAERKDLVSTVSATGSIEARTKVNVQSSVIGEIVRLPVKEGDEVRKGDLLVQIDPERYRSEVDRLEANLRMQRIAVQQQEVTLTNLRRTLERNRSLHDEGGIVSMQLLEDSELAVRTAEINLDSLREQVSQAEANLAKARDELAKTTIRSPIDGVVTQLNAEEGEITLTGTMNNPGTVILVVSDMGEILAEVDVDENRVVQVRPGQRARIVVDAVGETHPYRGVVSEIAGTAVRRAGEEVQVFPVKIVLDEVDPRLRPGMTAKARIETLREENALTVPIQAVLLLPEKDVEKILAEREEKAEEKDRVGEPEPEGTVSDGGVPAGEEEAEEAEEAEETAGTEERRADKREVVYRVVDGKAVLTPVRTGISDESDIVILDGLDEGDTVVTGPYRALKRLEDGDEVQPADDSKKKSGDEDEESGDEGQ